MVLTLILLVDHFESLIIVSESILDLFAFEVLMFQSSQVLLFVLLHLAFDEGRV